MLPWVAPPAEDLAKGADVKFVDAKTVEIVPHGAGKKIKTQDGKEIKATSYRLRLIFDDSGLVLKRQIVEMPKDKILLVNLSGRGDKDMSTVAERSGLEF